MNDIKVLIVDDDLLLGQTLKMGLEEIGMQAYYYDTLDDVFKNISEIHPDVIVLDIEIGNDNGLIMLQQFQEHCLSIPTIIMSSHTEVCNVTEALKNGALHFMKKPFEIEELGAYINRFAGLMHTSYNDKIMNFGGCMLNVSSHTLTNALGKDYHLTLKQFQILLILVENAGRTVERNVIKDLLWPDGNSSEASLDNYISQLRKMLEVHNGVEIHTIPKHGFVLKIDQDSASNTCISTI